MYHFLILLGGLGEEGWPSRERTGRTAMHWTEEERMDRQVIRVSRESVTMRIGIEVWQQNTTSIAGKGTIWGGGVSLAGGRRPQQTHRMRRN